jgi:hypothetical protein
MKRQQDTAGSSQAIDYKDDQRKRAVLWRAVDLSVRYSSTKIGLP